MSQSFQQVLPRLVKAYEQGTLVPFTGAGLSVPACLSWGKFISGLETVVIEYDNYAELPPMLDQLADAIEGNAYRSVHWAYSVGLPAQAAFAHDNGARLEIARQGLPSSVLKNECIAVSAGGEDTYVFSNDIHQLLAKMRIRSDELSSAGVGFGVARFGDHPVFAVRARAKGDQYDLGVIGQALKALLDGAATAGFSRVHAQLLAAGGKHGSKAKEEPSWRRRSFPAHYSLIEMVRAYASWLEEHREQQVGLTLYVLDRSVLRELASGRLDVLELLASSNLIRFWSEIVSGDGQIERRLLETHSREQVGKLAKDLDLPSHGWQVEVIPSGRSGVMEPWLLKDVESDTIGLLGVVPSSTLRFSRSGNCL